MIGRLSFTAKMLLLPFVAALGFVSLIVVSVLFGGRNTERLDAIERRFHPALQLGRDLEDALASIQRTMQDAVAAAEPSMVAESEASRARYRSELDETRQAGLLEPERISEIEGKLDEYYELAARTTLQMIAGAEGESMQGQLQAMMSSYNETRDLLAANTERNEQTVAASFAAARDTISISTRVAIAVAALCLLMLSALAIWVSRLVSRTLNEVTAGFRRMTAGNLQEELAVLSKDELGELATRGNEMMVAMRSMAEAADRISRGDLDVEVRPRSAQDQLGNAFVAMIAYLNQIARVLDTITAGDLTVEAQAMGDADRLGNSQVAMLFELKRLLAKMRDVIDQLASASQQISTTAREFAASADQQATTVVEVSTTADEINQASTASTNMARDVVQASEKAVDNSQRGLSAAIEANEVMGTIAQRLDGLAKSIVALSERNVRIGEIVGSVKDLADQSNLLAVNASIEAAKAGERGAGFAVVAAEVRGLADQSRQATQQIRGIIEEVQQATSAAVMSTEECNKHAVDGKAAVGAVHDVIEELAQVLEDAAAKSRQIAGASQQQAAGISDITSAIQGLSEGAKASADGAKSLEQATSDLTTLGTELSTTVSQYRI